MEEVYNYSYENYENQGKIMKGGNLLFYDFKNLMHLLGFMKEAD